MKTWFCFAVLSCFCAIAVTDESSTQCTTPNGEKASCVLLFTCPLLFSASQTGDPLAVKFVQESACGTGSFMVCCGTSGNFTKKENTTEVKKEPTKEEKREFALKNLLPNKRICGMQHTDDYFYNSTQTSVDEFPWMVYIPSKAASSDYSRSESNSVGFLINNRYILTDKNYNWRSVTIGQHYIYKDVSCISTSFGEDDCTNPSLNEYIDDFITTEESNIALLRLARKIVYTDYIRPICLPIDELETPGVDDTIVTSGWGEEENSEGKDVKIKKRVKYNLMRNEDCELANPVPHPLCGVAFKNSSTYVCPGDNGGPLMYRYKKKKKNWVALGVVSGSFACSKYQPVIAERITPKIVDWILENLKP